MTNVDLIQEAYCDYLYQNTSSAIRYSKGDLRFWQSKKVSLTYGEILHPCLSKVLDHMAATGDDVLLDCGSGMGKAAVGWFLQQRLKKIIGIEASLLLHQQAEKVKLQLQVECPEFFRTTELTFMHANFLTYPGEDVTLAYTCSTCFSEELINLLGARLSLMPNLRTVASLKPLPTLFGFSLQQVFNIECSWDSSLCFIYSRAT